MSIAVARAIGLGVAYLPGLAMRRIAGGLKSGSVNPGTIATLGGLLSKVKGGAAKAGVPVTEQQVPLGG